MLCERHIKEVEQKTKIAEKIREEKDSLNEENGTLRQEVRVCIMFLLQYFPSLQQKLV